MEREEFCFKISNMLRHCENKIQLNCEADKITYIIENVKYTYTIDEFEGLKKFAEQYEFDNYAIYNGHEYETMVNVVDSYSRRAFSALFEDRLLNLSIRDETSHIDYSFGEISNELIWHTIKHHDVYNRSIRISPMFFEKRLATQEQKDIISIIRLLIRLPFVVFVKSDSVMLKEELKKSMESFLFNIAYNFDYVLKPVTEIEDIFPKRIHKTQNRAKDPEELVAPQLLYNEELLEQYYMALTSDDPFVEFIAYYHIMEYFFERVYNEDICTKVKQQIQHPGFSVKRDKDIVKVVDMIKRMTKQSNENFQGSEIEALALTINKFVDISELIANLTDFDPSIVDYYKTTEVSFSNGDAVDLKDKTNQKLCKKIANRIYKTRNALVHSKSNDYIAKERGIYKPFKNNKELSKEIPLMRYISEAIIIKSAT